MADSISRRGAVLASVPIVILYFIGQRFVVQGLAAGSVKGRRRYCPFSLRSSYGAEYRWPTMRPKPDSATRGP
jgi:hypothetical protein